MSAILASRASLFPMLTVIAILVAVAGCDNGRAAIEKAQAQVRRIAADLDQRTTDTGVYVRAKEGEFKETDPWGTPVKITYSQGGVAEVVLVRSAGPDREFQTDDDLTAQGVAANLKGIGEGIKQNVEETAAKAAKGAVTGAIEGVKESVKDVNPFKKKKPSDEAEPGEAQLPPDAEKGAAATIKPLTAEQLEQLLSSRLDGGMDFSFRQFANMFLVASRIHLGQAVGLMTSSEKIADSPLQSPFPRTYQPTLREFLDAIALQTHAAWKYDPSSKFLQSEVKGDSPVEGLAIFEFVRTKREKPFEITLAEGWKSIDQGNWVMHVPPDFPVGMDIYEMGTYSSADAGSAKEFLDKVRADVALEWAQRVNEDAKSEDIKPAKVGSYDALYYESMIPSQLDKEIRWRQWVLVVDQKCYFVVSTILPELDDKIFPDVEKMLLTFRVKKD